MFSKYCFFSYIIHFQPFRREQYINFSWLILFLPTEYRKSHKQKRVNIHGFIWCNPMFCLLGIHNHRTSLLRFFTHFSDKNELSSFELLNYQIIPTNNTFFCHFCEFKVNFEATPQFNFHRSLVLKKMMSDLIWCLYSYWLHF